MIRNEKRGGLKEDFSHYGTLGIEMLATILIGTLAGNWLDGRFHTEPWLLILGFLLGAGAGFRGIFRLLKSDERDKGK